MYKNEQKALLLTKDQDLAKKMESYLLQRYNLRTESVTDLLEVFNRLGGDNSLESSYELLILDENASGIQTASHALKTLKSKYTELNVLYLSNILEITPPYCDSEMEILPEYASENFRMEQIGIQLDKVLELLIPITKANSLAEIYDLIPRLMVKTFQADWALCSVLRLDQKPPQAGVAASDSPGVLDVPYEYPLKGNGYIDEMLTYFKPVHIPDLNEDVTFRLELEEKFTRRYRSALLLPMQFDGNCIGLLGLFTRSLNRLYRLPDLDLLQRLADMSAVAIITHFYKEFSDVDMDLIEEEVKSGNRGGDIL
ncbi:MAG TPA: GAF domain-containing protein [Candidatus Kapabacteria bacterium]|nr:GAF domain-containing protein [Candidatus Kapabacteria bacterium]